MRTEIEMEMDMSNQGGENRPFLLREGERDGLPKKFADNRK